MIRQLFTVAEAAAGACIMNSDLSSDEEQNETDIKDNLALILCQEVLSTDEDLDKSGFQP